MNDKAWELLKIILAVASGGLAGALFTYFVSKSRQRVEFVIKITDQYLDNFHEIGECKVLLAGPLAADKTNELNRIRKIGDWFELIAVFYGSGYLSKRLLNKTGLLPELRKFHELITRGKHEPNSPLNDAWLWWPNLDKLIKG